jgi:hypothetical protein
MSRSNRQTPQPRSAQPAQTAAAKKSVWHGLLLAIVVVLVVVVRLRLLALPLERDEGEYAYMGQLLLKGYAPFEMAYNMKFPGTSMMYALIMLVFGQSAEGIHAGFLLINLGTVLLIFLAARRFIGNEIAAFASASYALLSLSPAVLGNAAHATHFVMLFAVAGIFQLLMAMESKSTLRLFISGLLLGFCVLMKQSGIFFAAFSGLVFLYDQVFIQKEKWTRWMISATVLAAGIILPLAMLFLWLYLAGTFNRFWFWTMSYGSQYAGAESLSRGLANLQVNLDGLQNDFLILWLLAPLGWLLLWAGNYKPQTKLFITFLAIVSLASVLPGLYFRQHYFVLFLPVFSVLIAVAINFTGKWIADKSQLIGSAGASMLLFVIAGLAGIIPLRSYLFEQSMFAVSRSIYGNNPFPESVTIGRYIKNNTTETDRVAILGSEPQIYFYADRLSATGYIYTYSLMENQEFNLQMQEEMIAEIEAQQPEVLIFCRIPQSWLVRDESPDKILEWVNTYSTAYYDETGVMEIPPGNGPADFYWHEQVRQFKGTSDKQVYIFRRKKSAP